MDDRSALPCPRCRERLYVGRAEMTLHGCGRCGGVFLDNADSQRLVKAFPDDAVALSEHAGALSPDEPNLGEAAPCPVCAAPMMRTRIDRAGLDLDVCAAHGTWFDRGELRRVALALHVKVPVAPVTAGAHEVPPPGGRHPVFDALAAVSDEFMAPTRGELGARLRDLEQTMD
jgi:Zn-finger nucleic acid-binding protein